MSTKFTPLLDSPTTSSTPEMSTSRSTQQVCLLEEDPEWGNAVEMRSHQNARRSLDLIPQTRRHLGRPQTSLHRWGVVLAGGDGVRLREVGQWVCGDDRPKQFCPLLSDTTLLEETRERAERGLPPEQVVYSVNRAHEQYYLPIIGGSGSQRIVQPFNKGTAPAIVSAMICIAQTDPSAIVAVLPCDHYYSPVSAFTTTLESAFEIAEQRSDSIVLLGVDPESPESDYGWIATGEAIDGKLGLFRVQSFEEKPPVLRAQTLRRNHSLWNTFVMIGHVWTFLEIAWATVPNLLQALESTGMTSHMGEEIRISDSAYERIARTDFSQHVLAQVPDRLLALRLKNVEWSDLGDPYRLLLAIVKKNGNLPNWASLWLSAQPVLRAAAARA